MGFFFQPVFLFLELFTVPLGPELVVYFPTDLQNFILTGGMRTWLIVLQFDLVKGSVAKGILRPRGPLPDNCTWLWPSKVARLYSFLTNCERSNCPSMNGFLSLSRFSVTVPYRH